LASMSLGAGVEEYRSGGIMLLAPFGAIDNTETTWRNGAGRGWFDRGVENVDDVDRCEPSVALIVKSIRLAGDPALHAGCVGKCECFRPGEVARLSQVATGHADVLLTGAAVARKRPVRVAGTRSSQAAET
jgi:hypothetical protein